MSGQFLFMEKVVTKPDNNLPLLNKAGIKQAQSVQELNRGIF